MKKYRSVIGFLISLFFIYIILWKPDVLGFLRGSASLSAALFGSPRINFIEVWGHLSKACGTFVLLTFLVTPVHLLVRSHRWTLMVEPVGKLKLTHSFSIQTIGNMANTIFPMRLGEVAKVLLLSRKININASASLVAVILERLLDALGLLGVFILTAFMFKFPGQYSQEFNLGVILFAAVCLVAVAVIFALATVKNPLNRIVARVTSLLPKRIGDKARRLIVEFIEGFAMMRASRHYAMITGETIFLWVLYGLQNYWMLLAFNIPADYPVVGQSTFLVVIVVLSVMAAALSIPSAPGGVGTFHAAAIFGLSLFSVDAAAAAGFAVAIHLLSTSCYVGGGLICLWHEGLNLGDLRNAKRKMQNSE